ncbi:hypothetical protein Tco_0563902 [Tanacetum coccineum]
MGITRNIDRVLRIILVILLEHQSDTQVITLKMEILLESTSNKLMVGDLCDSIRIKLVTTGKKRWCEFIRIKVVLEHAEFDESNTNVLERFYTSAGNPVKEILLKLNLPDHRLLKDGGEVKEFQRSFCHSDTERLSRSDEVLKLKHFKKDATLKPFKSTNQERYEHVGPEVTSSQDGKGHKMAKRDYAWLMISRESWCQTLGAKLQKWCHVSKMEFGTRNAMAPEFSGSGLALRILVP